MHHASGLLAELTSQEHVRREAGGPPVTAEAEQLAIAFVQRHAPGRSSPLCGANVGGYDRQWLRRHMPMLEQMFHYRNFETNSFWLAEQRFLGGDPLAPKAATRHRVLDDCRESVQTVRKFFGLGG